MGAEFGQTAEWNSEARAGVVAAAIPEFTGKFQAFCAALNELIQSEPALYEVDFHVSGFRVDRLPRLGELDHFLRAPRRSGAKTTWCSSATSRRRRTLGYRIGMPEAGGYREIFNSDAEMFGGSNMGNGGYVEAEPTASHGRPHQHAS